jgi:hypothetical protein
MNIQLLEHLNKNIILVEEQFGFRTNEILKAPNTKNLIGGIFMTSKRPLIASITKLYCQNWNSVV